MTHEDFKRITAANKAIKEEIESQLAPAYGVVGNSDVNRRTGANKKVIHSVLQDPEVYASKDYTGRGRPTKSGITGGELVAWMGENVREVSREEVIANLQRILSNL